MFLEKMVYITIHKIFDKKQLDRQTEGERHQETQRQGRRVRGNVMYIIIYDDAIITHKIKFTVLHA